MKRLRRNLVMAVMLGAGLAWAGAPAPQSAQASGTGGSGASWTVQTGSTDLNQVGVSTLWFLHQMSQLQIHAGALAQTNSASQNVRKEGQTLVNDFQALDKDVTQFAQKHQVRLEMPGVGGAGQAGTGNGAGQGGSGQGGSGQSVMHPATVTISGQEAQLVMQGQSTQSQLRDQHGQAFDQRFLSDQIHLQGGAIEWVNNQVAQLDNGDMRGLVQQALGKLQASQQRAQQLLRQIREKKAHGK